MLALRSFQARIRPERSSYPHASFGITWTSLVSGIGATLAPARLECEPRLACHWLKTVFLNCIVFLLSLPERGELLFLFIGTLLSLVQPTRSRFDLPATAG